LLHVIFLYSYGPIRTLHSFPTRRSSDLFRADLEQSTPNERPFMKFVSLTKPMAVPHQIHTYTELRQQIHDDLRIQHPEWIQPNRSEEHTSELQSLRHLVCRLLLEKKKKK